MNAIIDCYLVGLVLGAGFSGITASLFTLHRNLAATLQDSLLSDD